MKSFVFNSIIHSYATRNVKKTCSLCVALCAYNKNYCFSNYSPLSLNIHLKINSDINNMKSKNELNIQKMLSLL